MKIALHNYYETLNHNNAAFLSNSYSIGSHLEYPFLRLRERFYREGVELVCSGDTDKPDAVIFIDYPDLEPTVLDVVRHRIPFYLVCLENPMHRPQSYDPFYQSQFRKVFTWEPDAKFSGRIIKTTIPQYIRDVASAEERYNLICMIACNKTGRSNNELYTERSKAVRLLPLDLYGFGWDDPKWKGVVRDKLEVYGRYRFAVCYENEIRKGYVTEKIWDCLFAGTIPVYLGDPLIDEKIPAGCFIDAREYVNNPDGYFRLEKDLKEMPEARYKLMRDNIHRFLASEQAQAYSAEVWADTIVSNILEDLK